ncbi:MAG: hypothetical protein IH811_03930 [Proteobacteria bacterium]|nr:hypothetical protein [Pseudomonadota bacterium]
MKITPVTCLLYLAIYLLSAGVYAANVKVIGLFTDKALLIIDSQQKLLSKGQTFGGVTLISASSRGAVVSIDGEIRKLGLNQGIQGNYKKPDHSVSKFIQISRGCITSRGVSTGTQPVFWSIPVLPT